MNILQIDTGKLSFHLRALSAFVDQNPKGKYKLSRTGERALNVIRDVELWAECANVKAKSSQRESASFATRSIAFLIDGFLMLGVTFLFALPEFFPFLLGGAKVLNLGAVPFVALGLLFVYSTLLEGFSGQTLGKRLMGLKVVKVDGKAMDYEHSAVRNFGKTFLLPLDLLAGLQYKADFLRYFDKFAGTTVIDLMTKPKPVQVTAADTCEESIAIAQ